MVINTLLRKCNCFILDRCTGTGLIRHHGQEYTLEGKTYDYKLVLGKSITQKQKTGAGSWLLGNYASGTNDMETYDNGDDINCGGDIKRHATISFRKGENTLVLEENEPSTCNYEFVFQIDCKDGKTLVITILKNFSCYPELYLLHNQEA